jgi:exopolyphosphatase / guanosine-5'-triphosphate,3'-diphosphate pyrophosphatase
MALRAGIDIGTNTILLLIAEVSGGVVTRVLEDHVRVVRLGQGVDKNRAFHPEALERARACFAEYAQVLKKYPGIEIRAVATSGSRDARNSGEFFAEIKERFGIPIRVISGEEEALLSFRGALPKEVKDPHEFAVLDIGGGSTEIVGLEPGSKDRLFRFSFDIGCVRLSERYLASDPATSEQVANLRAFVQKELAGQKQIVEQLRGRILIGVAGTATYLASAALGLAKFDPEKVDGSWLSAAGVNALYQRFLPMTAAQRLGLGGMDRGRADVIVAGAVILQEVLAAARLEGFRASVRGLRYGAVVVD